MQSPTQNKTSSYARYRLLTALGGKLADAAGLIITIKTLAPGDYGVVGIALGVMAVLGFVTVAPEDILWRDLPKLRDRLAEHLGAFAWFWLVKLAAVAVVAAVAGAIYGHAHHSWTVAGCVFGIVIGWQLLSSSALAEVPLFAGLQQQRGAAFVLGVRGLWLALLVPNFWWHSLPYYTAALIMYAAATAVISFWLLRTQFGVNLRFQTNTAWPVVRAAIVEFSVWLHLGGRTRVFLARGDLAVLSVLGVTLARLGGYTVAINLAGFALIVPGVLENVAAVSFAHEHDRAKRQRSFRLLTLTAALLAAGELGGGALFGRTALRLLHATNVEAMFHIFMILLAGVAVFACASASFAFALCFRRMQRMFLRLWLPVVGVFIATVWFAANRWGLTGAAWAHASVMAGAAVAAIVYVQMTPDDLTATDPSTADAESAFQE